MAKPKPKSKQLGLDPHWAFFEAIDEDLHEYSRYLEFHRDNFKAYSVNLARLYLSICSEVDVLLKVMCAKLGQPAKSSKIDHYRSVIVKQFPNFGYFRVLIRPMQQIAMPWLKWRPRSRGQPEWWHRYNDVKHERNLYFAHANLENVLSAASALYIVLFYCHCIENKGIPPHVGFEGGRMQFKAFRVFALDNDMQELVIKRAILTRTSFSKVPRWGRPPLPPATP
jgi:hypothetical protein